MKCVLEIHLIVIYVQHTAWNQFKLVLSSTDLLLCLSGCALIIIYRVVFCARSNICVSYSYVCCVFYSYSSCFSKLVFLKSIETYWNIHLKTKNLRFALLAFFFCRIPRLQCKTRRYSKTSIFTWNMKTTWHDLF